MTRRIRTTLLAATAASALLLTACGGSDSSDDEIEGVNEGDNQQQEQSQEATDDTQEGVDRPEIELPDGFENEWEDWESDDAEEQAVLSDAREAQNAVDLAIMEQDSEANYVDFYHSSEALLNAQDWIEEFIDNNGTLSGTVRYFNPEVTIQSDDGATITYCADESEGIAVDIDTGEQLSEDTGKPFVFYSNILQKDGRGVWVTTSVVSERQKECS